MPVDKVLVKIELKDKMPAIILGKEDKMPVLSKHFKILYSNLFR